jgi:hypothetical protein
VRWVSVRVPDHHVGPFAVMPGRDDAGVAPALFLTLMSAIGAALTITRLLGTRRHRRRISDVPLLLLAAVLLRSPETIPAAAAIEAQEVTQRVVAEAGRVSGWIERGLVDRMPGSPPRPPRPAG